MRRAKRYGPRHTDMPCAIPQDQIMQRIADFHLAVESVNEEEIKTLFLRLLHHYTSYHMSERAFAQRFGFDATYMDHWYSGARLMPGTPKLLVMVLNMQQFLRGERPNP